MESALIDSLRPRRSDALGARINNFYFTVSYASPGAQFQEVVLDGR